MSTLHMLADALLPDAGSNLATDVDWAWHVILFVTGAFFCIVVGAMTFFVIKYRRRTANDATSEITHNTPLEIIWTAVPLILVIGFFWIGFKGFLNYDTPPSDCQVVNVTGQKWSFTFKYPNGATAPNLYVMRGQDVKLDLTSVDVLHALYIPAFRTQRNLIPYRQTSIWFRAIADSPSEGWPIFCTQYCGNGHSTMTARVFVLAPDEYRQKMAELANPYVKKEGDTKRYRPYFEVGEQLYREIGCKTCHTVDGSTNTGPTWKNMWKSKVDFSFVSPSPDTLHDAGTTDKFTLDANSGDTLWEEYIRESVSRPEVKIVKGFNPGMPTYASRFSGANQEDLYAIIEYMKSLAPGYDKDAIEARSKTDAYDADKNPVHPESRAARAAATQSQSAPATGQ